jgi:hypothetical protein
MMKVSLVSIKTSVRVFAIDFLFSLKLVASICLKLLNISNEENQSAVPSVLVKHCQTANCDCLPHSLLTIGNFGFESLESYVKVRLKFL